MGTFRDLKTLTLVEPTQNNQELDPLTVLHLDNQLLMNNPLSIKFLWFLQNFRNNSFQKLMIGDATEHWTVEDFEKALHTFKSSDLSWSNISFE